MADDDLVAQVTVEGTDELAAKLAAYAETGQQSFDKLNTAAAKSAAGVAASTRAVEDSAKDASKALQQVGNTKISPAPAQNLKAIQQAANSVGTEVRKSLKDLASFATRVAAMGTAAVAAGAGILTLAASVAKQAAGTSDALDKQTAAQVDANDASLTATQASINYQSSQRKLLAQLQSGAIDYDTYAKSVKQLNTDYTEQTRVSAQVAAAQDAVKDANDRLTKQLADQKAYNSLIDKFGGPLLTSMITLGNEVGTLYGQFQQAFGPAIAGFIDVITATLSKNSGAIGAFFDSAAGKINDFVKNNTPAIQKALESTGRIAASIFDGLINAAPILLGIFNNQIVPAIDAVGAALQKLTDGINSLFGTNFTPGVTAAVIAIGTLSGGFKLALTAVRLFSAAMVVLSSTFAAFGIVISPITLAIVALGLLFAATQVDWTAVSVAIVTAWGKVRDFFIALPGQIGGVFKGIWDAAVAGVAVATTAITDAWNAVVAFFSSLPATIGQIFTDVGNAIVQAFNSAITQVETFLQDLATSALGYLQPVIDALKTIIALSGQSDGGAGGGAQAFARGGAVRGRGTSTSDSIPAWLSNNEYVMKAKAVWKYGKNFMDDVNSGRLDLGSIARFAAGGLVGSFTQPRLAFATPSPLAGASTSVNRIVNLTIGDQRFENLLAPEDVADRMERYAVARNSTSAGRKPSWVGGSR